MERPKQQALAFLLGALLVGGVLGFSADRVFRQEQLTPAQRRAQFYEDIGITVQQRPVLDSLLDDRNCRMDSVVKTIQPACANSMCFACVNIVGDQSSTA